LLKLKNGTGQKKYKSKKRRIKDEPEWCGIDNYGVDTD